MRVRFAPSPTGFLHLGNTRTALVNWLFAQQQGGVFILRMDDTDLQRSQDHYETAIREDLAWLGLCHQEEWRQRDRLAFYERAAHTLKDQGRLYPCYETPEELRLKRKTLLARGLPPLYDRGSLNLTAHEKQAYEAQGRRPHWRFRLQDTPVIWKDLVRGEVAFQGNHLSDPVLIREDGLPLYTLSSVVDDGDFSITHIIRGEDHVTNTAVQIQLFEALGWDPRELQFAHLNLLTDPKGAYLSKRTGSLSIRAFREQGIEPMALNNYLAKLGTSEAVHAHATLEDLAQSFDFKFFSRSSPKFSPEEVKSLNLKILHQLSFKEAQKRFPSLDSDLWTLVRENLETFEEVAQWKEILQGSFTPPSGDPEFLKIALEVLPSFPWSMETFKTWTATLKTRTGRKGKELFMPLRLALTGKNNGPALDALLLFLGYEKVVSRLKQAGS